MRQELIICKGEIKMTRVSKPTAKKLYHAGKTVRCAMIYDRPSNSFEVSGDFEKFENDVLYYNACKERGNYLKFYVEC